MKKDTRRGYALILVLGVLLLLITFLIAAQSAVLSGQKRAKDSQTRLDRGALAADALTQLRPALAKDPATKVEIARGGKIGATAEAEALKPEDAVYTHGHGLLHREGDFRATVLVKGLGPERPMHYLINTAGKRIGAIPIPAPEAAPTPTTEPKR